MSGEPIDHLITHLEGCLVLIAGHTEGSGFFIAPHTVATCAHVAGAVGAAVTVRWQDRSLRGVVRWASPLGGRMARYPDMAVVEVEPFDGVHPSVWLDDHRPGSKAELVAWGHARAYPSEPDAAPVSARFTNGGAYQDMIRLTHDEIEPGMSGGPVLNTQTGGVCGITKAARHKGEPAGGVAIPVRALREIMRAEAYRELRRRHDEHHRRNKSWLKLAERLPPVPGTIGAVAERQLREVLDLLPAAGHEEHLADFQAVAGSRAARVRHPLHEHGDVVTELSGLAPPDDRIPHVIAYALHLARNAGPTVAARLTQWALMAAPADDREKVEAQIPAGPAGSPLPSLLVYVRPDGADQQRYLCEFWQHDGTGLRQLEADGRDRSEDQLREHLRERLPGLVEGENPPMVELVLPMDLLDEDVEQWPRAGRHAWTVIGQNNPVVVREQQRFEEEDEAVLTDWQKRWDGLRDRPVGSALMPVTCAERRTERALFSQFRVKPGIGAVVLPDTPRKRAALRAVLDVGLYAGIPIMVWRRNGCAGEDGIAHDGCAGAELTGAITAALAGAGRDEVPRRIMELRNQAVSDEHPELGNDVVVLWDDPGRRLKGRPMTPPKGEWHAGG
ncbi:VMAP-C domain-containing protein [Actinoplanes siamensis]|uniref:Trypsin-like peptidase n=1 Tax=Actinoplanes siamensis TaxID=1223317 RepID=A0A919N3K9_9ACTN|nr:trypsin-like peptidase domain-containing protein [Actinoplanes siamensis]GIF03719.1 hypothetical protein Asi03nite_12570 [Actinoplanes siamensis]